MNAIPKAALRRVPATAANLQAGATVILARPGPMTLMHGGWTGDAMTCLALMGGGRALCRINDEYGGAFNIEELDILLEPVPPQVEAASPAAAPLIPAMWAGADAFEGPQEPAACPRGPVELSLGHGSVLLSHVTRDGRRGLWLSPRRDGEAAPIGSPVFEEPGEPKAGDVVIWFDGAEGAGFMIDLLTTYGLNRGPDGRGRGVPASRPNREVIKGEAGREAAGWGPEPMHMSDFLDAVGTVPGQPGFMDDLERLRQVQRILVQVGEKVRKAEAKWPALNSAHEGYGVLMEEVRELEEHVFMRQPKRDLEAMRAEALDVAACAVRFALNICDQGRGRK